jgi:hypothetical protein
MVVVSLHLSTRDQFLIIPHCRSQPTINAPFLLRCYCQDDVILHGTAAPTAYSVSRPGSPVAMVSPTPVLPLIKDSYLMSWYPSHRWSIQIEPATPLYPAPTTCLPDWSALSHHVHFITLVDPSNSHPAIITPFSPSLISQPSEHYPSHYYCHPSLRQTRHQRRHQTRTCSTNTATTIRSQPILRLDYHRAPTLSGTLQRVHGGGGLAY